MEYVFTDYVRTLAAAAGSSGGLPPEVWEKLRDALVAELRKRSLWHTPPSYLGIYGATSWTDEGALEELLCDCFSFIFIERLPSLGAQLEIKDNIEGLVFLSLRNFLYDTQKRHDPLGFKVFQVAQTALRLEVGAGRLRIVAGPSKIANDTVLAFAGDEVPETADAGELEARVAPWIGELSPRLVTARGKGLERLAAELGERVAGLGREGVGSFRCRDLVGPLKRGVRAHWRAVWGEETGASGWEEEGSETLRLVPLVGPDTRVEELELFHQLIACVSAALDRIAEDARTETYLRRLWLFLRDYAAAADGEHDGEHDGALPSKRQLARLLEIPRDRLTPLHRTLGHLVEDCRITISAPLAERAVASLGGDGREEGR